MRLRVPGGALRPDALLALAAAAASYGDGRLGLTSRGNLQIRGIRPGTAGEIAAQVRASGLLPSASHERVRNIVASPLSGRLASSCAPIDALAADLDVALCLRPALAHLPGRFLFAVDDGSGDVAGLGADVLLQALGGGLISVFGLVVPEVNAVSAALAVAAAFLAERDAQGSQVWRIAELPDGAARVRARCPDLGVPVAQHHPAVTATVTATVTAAVTAGPEPGLIEQSDGRLSVCALLPLGLITAVQIQAIAAAAGLSSAEPAAALRLTPWRRIVLRDLELAAALAARELLAAHGLVVDGGTAWGRVTACAGRPGCAKALADVHADAAAFVAQAAADGTAVHLAGCERGCGTPVGPVAVAIATGRGYLVHGGVAAAERDWIGAR